MLPIEKPALDCFSDVVFGDWLRTLQIGDGPGDAKDSDESPRAQAQLTTRRFEQLQTSPIERRDPLKLRKRELPIAHHPVERHSMAVVLTLMGCEYSRCHLLRAFRNSRITQHINIDRWHGAVQIKAIQKRPTEPLEIFDSLAL